MEGLKIFCSLLQRLQCAGKSKIKIISTNDEATKQQARQPSDAGCILSDFDFNADAALSSFDK